MEDQGILVKLGVMVGVLLCAPAAPMLILLQSMGGVEFNSEKEAVAFLLLTGSFIWTVLIFYFTYI